jgi:acyl transferase domain-containing protein/acyl carrier protein
MHRSKTTDVSSGRIAIVGMAGRFPGANTVDDLWRNLREGVESISVIDLKDWGEAVGADPIFLGSSDLVKARPSIDGVDLFDAGFFGYTPREAQTLDPQQRLFLECAWEALEKAGYDSNRFAGAIGVCAGVSLSSYLINCIQYSGDLVESLGSFNIGLANVADSLATRVAYKLGLKGAAYSVQSFCSTSLLAVHLGCQSLLNHESDMMLAGGVTITVPQEIGYQYQEGGILSPDAHTRTFDAKGNGTIFGNGLGIVVLKRLKDALDDGDTIHAVILGSAVNNDGSLKVGFTAPSVKGQAEVIAEALQAADVDAETISYVEAHGTATALGDPAEIAGLTKAYRQWTDKKGFCAIGSVKTNIGHLDAAAGVAGLIKTVLSLEHRQIPASLHFEVPNPAIDFPSSPFYVNSKLADWNSEGPRRAGVSAFGIGGTNAHAILEEAPPAAPTDPAAPWQLLVLSAKTASGLDRASENLAAHLRSKPDLNLADMAYTLQVGRRLFNHRRTLVCRDHEDACTALGNAGRQESTRQDRQNAPVAFLFTGQGSQYLNMGGGLYLGEPVFRQGVDTCSEILTPLLGFDLRGVLYPKEGSDGAAERLTETSVTQPALFVIEYAMARLWMAWGVEPTAMLGHSVGEYVAAHLAGVFTLEDALALVAERGRLMQSVPRGSMLAIPLSEEGVQPYLESEVSLASVNAPSACVLSGSTSAIERVQAELTSRGVMSQRLRTSHAFHSAMMDPILDAFVGRVARAGPKPPAMPFLSNVTGTWITDAQATDPRYWAQHLRQAVRFSDGVKRLREKENPVLLEVGPGNTLTALARQQLDGQEPVVAVASLRHPKDGQNDRAFLLNALGKLWLAGVAIDYARVHRGSHRRRIPLPTYPFERQRYWVDKDERIAEALRVTKGLSFKRLELSDRFYQPSWRRFPPAEILGPLPEDAACWLLFLDDLGLGPIMAQQLKEWGQRVVTVRAGAGFDGSLSEGFVISPGQPRDYAALIRALALEGSAPLRIVHLWGLTPNGDEASSLERLGISQERGFYSLLSLAQALGREKVTQPVRMAVVTNHLHDVTGNESIQPEKSTILGPCKVIPLESKNIACLNIDVEVPDLRSEPALQLIRHLIADVMATGFGPAIAYRGKHRWVQSLEKVPLGPANGASLLKEGGIYLITGGLGGIGLVLASHLAQHFRAKLILTSRSGLPAREQWVDWLASHPEDDSLCRKIRLVRELEAAGGEVLVVAADVTSLEDMGTVVHHAHQRFGGIDGVIHAAGVPGGGIVQVKEAEAAAKVMAPKLQGTLVLDSLLREEKLDFMVLCSSTTAVLGGFGQVDYCAANAFLDAFAHHAARRSGPRVISINWDAWKEVGMAVETAVPEHLRAERDFILKLGISPAEGAQAFMRSLESGLSQVVMLMMDLSLITSLAENNRREAASESSAALPASVQVASEGPDIANLESGLEQTIAGIWRRVLGVQSGGNDNFFELGGDSVTALQVMSLLTAKMGREIPVVTLYEAPTVRLLAEAIGAGASGEKQTVLTDVEQRAETRRGLMEKRRRPRSAPPALNS